MPEDLAGEQAFGVLAAQARGDGDRRVDVGQAEQGGGAGTLQRLQAQYRTGDDAEGAFGADEQLLEVVAGGVLQQPAQVAVDAAVGEYRFQAEHALAHGAEAEGADAAGVGRYQPADAGAAARGEIDAGVESGLGGQRLGLFEGDAGVEVEGLAGRIQPVYAVQPAQREQHVAGLRGAAADQTGESALGHQGASRLAAQTHHGSDLVGAFRQDQEASGEVLRMVAGVLPGERGTVAHATGAEDLAEGAVEFGIVHGGLRVRDGRARLAAPRRSADGPPGRRAAVRAGARDRARVRRRSRSRGRWRGSPGCRYRPRAE